MQRRFLATLAIVLLAAPMAFASHNYPLGSPRGWCETEADDDSHEYGLSTSPRLSGGDFNRHDCDGDGVLADFDGHADFAFGGGWLTSAHIIGCNDGARIDHAAFPIVSVEDYYLTPLGVDVAFSVYADTLNNIPPVDPNEPNCGDGESDFGVDCVSSCQIAFPPGLDGTYQVYVNGVTGAIYATSANGGGIAGEGERRFNFLDVGHVPVPPVVCDGGLCVDVPDQGSDPGAEPQPPNPVEDFVQLVGAHDEGSSTEACGSLHVHGSWRGSYFYGTTQVHLHHCGGNPNHWNGWVAYSWGNGDRAPGLSYWGHDAVSVYYNDYKYHRPCIWMQQQDGTWVGPVCYWQYN